MRRVPSTSGVELSAFELGGSGPALLMAHATGFHGHVWEPLANELAPDFRCVAFDERGHGDATAPDDGDFDWHGFADDVLAVVDAFDLQRPFAIGHSAGGAALLLAEIARPGTFEALYCFEPIVLPADPPVGPQDNPLSQGALRRREVFPSKAEALTNFSSKPPFSSLHADALRAYVEWGFADEADGTVRLKCRREHEAAVYRMGSAHSAFPNLASVSCPVHLACGERTDAITPPLLERLADRLPRPTTEVLPGLGHFAPLEDPAAVAASLRRAFGR